MDAHSITIGSTSAGVDYYGTDEEGFPLVFWTVLSCIGYVTHMLYLPINSVEQGVPQCHVNTLVSPPPHLPDLPSIDMEVYGYRYEDTRALAALRAMITFC